MSFTALMAVAVVGQAIAHYLIEALNSSLIWSHRPEGAERARNDLLPPT